MSYLAVTDYVSGSSLIITYNMSEVERLIEAMAQHGT